MSGGTTVSVVEGESPRKKPSGRAWLPRLRITAPYRGCGCSQLRGREGCWVLVGWGNGTRLLGRQLASVVPPKWCWHPPPPPKPCARRARRKAPGYLEKEAPSSVPFNFPATPPIGRHWHWLWQRAMAKERRLWDPAPLSQSKRDNKDRLRTQRQWIDHFWQKGSTQHGNYNGVKF